MTETRIGKRNQIREFVTIHRGTSNGGGLTQIGDDNLLMAQAHVAHDCRLGNGNHNGKRRNSCRSRHDLR
ncbi:MAG: hypothetical protein HC846_02330 [Blastocatellia bacterium]|nr:hypothetical protein [Blastocatellia bacterium]